MSKPDVIMREYRRRSTALLDALGDVNDVLSVVEGVASDDAGRQAFFAGFFTEFPDYDMSAATFFDSVVKWRELRTWIQTAANFVPINQTRTD
jgi:hypothetical protein